MNSSLDAKLLALGQAGRSRLTKAWTDPETTTTRIKEAFGLRPPDIARLKSLIGPRPMAEVLKRCAPRGLGVRQ